MNSDRPRRLLRLGTVVPTVAVAVVSLAVAVTTASPPAPPSRSVDFADRAPIGHLDRIYQTPGGMRAFGWAFDPDSPRLGLRVYSKVDGVITNSVTAADYRADVATAYPGAGGAHGFELRVPASEGTHTICIRARNVLRGTNVTLGCATKKLDYGPFGRLDAVDTRPGALHVKGWAIDSDKVTAPIATTVKVDGVSHALVANRYRPDIADVRKGAGPYHGFEVKIAATQGKHTVCVTLRSIGYGADNSFACRSVTLNDNPFGRLELLAQQSGKLRMRGWVLDRDRPSTPLTLSVRIDAAAPRIVTAGVTRLDVARSYPGTGTTHGFDQLFALSEGRHRVCVTAKNVGYGSDGVFACRTPTLNFRPAAYLAALTANSTGVTVTGWAADPDTSAPISVRITVDGRIRSTMIAGAAGTTHSGHNFTTALTATSGLRTVCVTAINVLYGSANSPASCRTITLALKPLGRFESVRRSGTTSNLLVTGWAFDPDTTAASSVAMTVDGLPAGTYRAAATRTDVASRYPSAGAAHGISTVLTANDGEHRVCLVAKNVSGGSDTGLGCRLIIAVHPVAPSAPRSVTAVPGYGSAKVYWTRPASDGGAPWTKYVVVASPGGRTVTVSAAAIRVTVNGLAAGASYTFAVRAVNVAGPSAAGTSPRITTLSGPALQRTPAPISTSRYIRNIRGSSATEQALMRREGAADAAANTAGHRYLMLLDIGGQNQTYGGVVLSATTRFVTYADLVRDVKAYLDGYHSAQRSTAPATIAIGTNNDMDVNATTGRAWATAVVNPLVSYARKYTGMTVSGANDIEPGFSASYPASKNWLSGFLSATSAKFIFNGSADGCAWTVTNRGCNNGWTMAGLYYLAAGAAPTRIVNLPQVYNYTMADQWKFISLTGVYQSRPRINFGGPLTEYTACAQAGSCGSIGGVSAWTRMWNNLQSHPMLKVASLPYATDLRIDR